MNRLAITNTATTHRHLLALLVTGLVALPLAQARAAGNDAVPRHPGANAASAPMVRTGRVVDLGSLEGIVVTPGGNYSRSEWDARQRRLAEQRVNRLAARASTLTPVAYGPPGRQQNADGQGVPATRPGLPAATWHAVTLSLPTPSAGI